MKIKENQENKRICFGSVFARAVLCALIMLFALPISTYADEPVDFLVENYNLTETHLSLLGEDASYYSSIDKDAQKAVSTSVVASVNNYRKQILDLQSHPDAATRSLQKEVQLAYAKGRAAGRLSWVYFYQNERLGGDESRANIKSEYEKLLLKIDSATEETVLSAEADLFCAELNNTIYLHLLSELARSDDSLSSSAIIAGSIEELAGIRDFSLFAEGQEELYQRASASLALSRAADKASSELSSLFSIIRSGEDHQSNATVALFTYKLKNAQSVKAINDALSEAVCSLLSADEDDLYTRIYVADLCAKIAEENLKAGKSGEVLSILHLFLNYTAEREKAEAKDEIRALIYSGGRKDELLDRLEAEFNSDGGRIDLSSGAAGVREEKLRAKYIIECYESYQSAKSQIEISLEPYEKQEHLALIEAIYKDGADSLRKLSSSPEFEKLCSAIASERATKFTKAVVQAKAERFLLDHADVISKPIEQLSQKDEIYLRHALDDYTKLEPSVANILLSQINSIAVKYNSVLSSVIRSMLAEDALYLDFCEIFCKEINDLERINIAEYYNNCDLVLNKAQALCEAIRHYRELCADELYASYNSSEREDLIEVCRDLATVLHSLDVDDKGIFASELSEACADAKTEAWRINERVRIRVCARSSDNPEIKAIILEANAKINSSRDKAEISSIADMAIFKISRILTSDTIKSTGERLVFEIEQMKFLRTSEKQELITNIKSLSSEASADALISENLTVLSFIYTTFSSSSAEIQKAAELQDLKLARESYAEKFDDESTKVLQSIRSMSHLPPDKCDEYSNKIAELRSKLKSSSDLAQTSKELAEIYLQTLDTLYSLEISADAENLDKYKEYTASLIEELLPDTKNYSTENYNTINKIISEAKQELAKAVSITACDSILKNTKERIALVNDLLDDAIDLAISSIKKQMEYYHSISNLYSASALERLNEIQKSAEDRIRSYTAISQIADVNREREQALQRLAEVKCDYKSTLPNNSTSLHSGIFYPVEFNYSSGLWGVLYSPSALHSESTLTIFLADSTDLRAAKKAIQKAARSKSISFFGCSTSKELLKELKHAKVTAALGISLSNVSALTQNATLTLLIPEDLAKDNILGIAFVDNENNVEFYNINQDNFLISFDLSHFSSYYIVAENTINLMPLIIFLTILITVEFIALIFILILRFNRKRKENDQMLPMLSPCFIPPLASFTLTQIKPVGAITTTILLTVAALALGCAAAMLTRIELSELRKSKQKPHTRPSKPQTRLLHAASSNALPNKKAALNPAREALEGEAVYYTEACAVALEDSDDAPQDDLDLESIFAENDEAYTCFGKAHHKAEINLDVIEEKFEDGDLVTLDALKRKHLVPKRTDYVKILARGALTKPLIVEANDFSRAAEEMLISLGGEAIRVRH